MNGWSSRLFNTNGENDRVELSSGDISRLLFVTARPGIQVLWSVLFVITLVYSLARSGPKEPWAIVLLVVSYIAVICGNHFFPYDRYRPYLFFLLLCACLALISSLVYLTGNKGSLLGFLFFSIPIYAAAYYSYTGTLLMSALAAVIRYLPFMKGAYSYQHLSLGLTAAAYLIVGFLACYIVEGEKTYVRESLEYQQLLEVSRDKEKEISLIYNLSRRFSYTLDLDTVLQTTAALAKKILSSRGALVFLREDGRNTLKAALGTLPFADISSVGLPRDESWVDQLLDGKNVIAERVSMEWAPLPVSESESPHNIAAVPLFLGKETGGYLMCFSPASQGFREYHLDILSTLASQAAIAVEKARLYRRTIDDKATVETILNALRDGLLVVDSDGTLVQANPVARQMLSIGDSDMGRKLVEILESCVLEVDLDDYNLEEALGAATEGRSIFGELTLEGDTQVTVQSNFIPLRDQMNKVTGMVLFVHDITELKRLDEMKSNFVSNVSHELRTPLTSIQGFVSLLLAGRAGPLTPSQEDYLKVVDEETDNLTDMIENLLDLSRIQARRGKTRAEKVDMVDVIETAIDKLSIAAAEKDIAVEKYIDEPLPFARAETVHMSRVVNNILENAIKFTEPGGKVDVAVLINEPFLQVQISDNGIGISEAAMPRIFERFYQARSGDTRDRGGFGLGLAICRQIVELHGGSIWLESSPGVGSTFYFTVPIYSEESGIS